MRPSEKDIFDILSSNNNDDFLSTLHQDSSSSEEFLSYESYENLSFEEIQNEIQKLEIHEDIEEKTENSYEEKTKTSLGKFLSGMIFLTKYIATSSLIFIVLIVSTNYSAYIEIAKSYFNPEILEESHKAMSASVESSIITKKDTPARENEDIQSEDENQYEQTTQELPTLSKIESAKNKTYHSMDKLVGRTKSDFNAQIEIVPYENRIVIPKIGKNIPLIDIQSQTVKSTNQLEDIFMNELINGIVRYPGSAKPGEIGNSFIFGHSSNFPWLKGEYNDVFALMDKLEFGDEIIAYYGQKKFIYKIKEKKIIKPGDVSVLKRDNNISEISLMTCWPVGTTLNRMIVVGELVTQ